MSVAVGGVFVGLVVMALIVDFTTMLISGFVAKVLVFLLTAGKVRVGGRLSYTQEPDQNAVWFGYREGGRIYVYRNWADLIGFGVVIASIFLCAYLFDWPKG